MPRACSPPADRTDVSFDAFFTHILAHEMTHGIGPQNGVRQSLKELHSAIEEAKADATGLFMLQYLFDHKLLPEAAEGSVHDVSGVEFPHAALRRA